MFWIICDEFIAISNILVESVKTQGRILKMTLTQEEQSNELKTLALFPGYLILLLAIEIALNGCLSIFEQWFGIKVSEEMGSNPGTWI